MRKKNNIIFLCLFLLVIVSFSTENQGIIAEVNVHTIQRIPTTINAEDDFEIYQDNQFSLYAENWMTGDGSELNPWIIRDLEVTLHPTADIGIWIHDTTHYFQLINCTIDANRYDVLIEDVAPGTATVKNCTFELATNGLGIINSAGAYVRDCIAYDCVDAGYEAINASDILYMYNQAYYCDRGFEITDSYSADLFWNEVYDAGYDHGMYILDSEDIAIQNSIIERSNQDGIHIENCTNAHLSLNTCSDNGYNGINVIDSEYALIQNNAFYDCDLGVDDDTAEDLLTYDVYLDNTINDEPIYYGENDNLINLPGWIQQYPQIILVNASNVEIVGQDVLAHNIYANIVLRFGENITIRGCYFEKSLGGILATDINNLQIIDCSFLDNLAAIGLGRTTNSLIQYNTLFNMKFGGIAISENADNNVVRNNTFEDIYWYAISITDSQYNYIYHNNFINCSSLYTSYGNDDGTNNYWYNPVLQEGNYWENWGGTGTYAIDGSAGSIDLYPLGSVIIIPEFSISSIIVSIICLTTLVSLIFVSKRRN